MKHIWSVLCTKSIIDQETNNLSLINVIEEIRPQSPLPEKGEVPFGYSLVTLWTRDKQKEPESGDVRIKFISPSGKTLQTCMEYTVTLDNNTQRSRVRAVIQSLPINQGGIYNFRIEYKVGSSWKKASEIPVTISTTKAQKKKTKKTDKKATKKKGKKRAKKKTK